MAEIALRTYVEQLDSLIERKQVDEVIAHCRHVLGLYPKHLDTYRMLGKALLEKGRHGDAADIFQRVMSVVPDDFISHVGMSIVREDETNLDAAIWHMERAFEAAPANGAIQQELCRLYGRRDGVIPPKARLTRGALARMYAQGGLYLQAEAELKAALAEQPDRIDLITVLARVYAQTDQPAQAAQACSDILNKLPYSLEANRILFNLFRGQGRADDAAVYRRRLEALDPYEAFVEPAANGIAAHHVEANLVQIERLEYVPGMEDSGSPDWLNAIGAKFDLATPSSAAEASPDWLAAPSEPPQPVAPGAVPGSAELPDWLRELQPEAPGSAPEPAEPAPDWLRELGASAEPPATLKPADANLPDWLRNPTGPLPADAVPEWMRPALEEQPTPTEAPTIAAADVESTLPEAGGEVPAWMTAAAASAPLAAEDLPEWMRPAAAEPEEPTGAWAASEPPRLPGDTPIIDTRPELPPEDATSSTPDWLQALEASTGQTAATPPAADLPDWLKPAGSNTEEVPDWLKSAAAPEAGGEELPEWMRSGGADTTLVSAGTAAPELPPAMHELDAETQDWLAATQGGAEAGEPAGAAAIGPGWPPTEHEQPQPPGWLGGAESGPPEPTLAAEAPAEPEAAELPEWLREGSASPSTPEATPAWMQTAPAMPTVAPIAETPAAESAGPAVPEWLQAKPAEPAEPEAPAELPDWLRAVAASAPTPDVDTPDWPPPAAASTPVELPDYLQPASPEAIARAEQPFDFVTEEPTGSADDEAGLVLPADIPDWLRGMAPVSPDPVAVEPSLASDVPVEPTAPISEPTVFAETQTTIEGGGVEASAQVDAGAPPEGAVEITPTDLPPWAQIEEPGPTDTIASWLAGQPKPPQAEPTAEAAATALPALPEAEPIEAEVEAASMDADEALRWLETLAVRQGADPSELLTTRAAPVEAAPPEPPAQPSAPPSEATESPALDAWLSQMEQALPAEPLADTAPRKSGPLPPLEIAESQLAAAEPEVAAAEQAPEAAEVSAMDADEALRWLEGLAARQGANPEELITAPEERTTETPTWIAALQPEPTTAESEQPTAEQLAEPVSPAMEAPLGVAEAQPAEAELPELAEPAALAELAASVPAEPMGFEDLTPQTPEPLAAEAIDEDEALRWLEGLAAQQGARPEELLTAPEDRPVETPAWIAAQQTPPPATPRPDWLPGEPAAPTEAASALAEPEAAPTGEAEPGAALEADEEALRWLEGLAAQQGASPDELLTTPAERLVETPDWIAAEQSAARAEQAGEATTEPEPLAEPEPAASVVVPDWLRLDESLAAPEAEAPVEASEPASAAPSSAAPLADVDKLSRLAERLAAARRTKEVEIEARFAEQRAQQEAARRQVQERMDSWRQAIEAGEATEPAPEAVEAPPPAREAAASPVALAGPDYPAAVERYASQVAAGEDLDRIVGELEGLAATPQAPAPVLRVLGDAYAKRDQLQEALSAYRAALARL